MCLAVSAYAAVAVACRGIEGPPTTVMEGDSADNVVFGIKHSISTDGMRRVRIEADTGYYYEAQQAVELRQLTVIFYSTEGAESSRITADWGTYNYRTGNMVARTNVVGITPDGRRLTTSKLEYNQVADRLETDEPFVFDSPDEYLEGSGFSADRDFRNVRVTNPREGRVRN
jgi:LPS export ABC transporter protein LptC